MLIVDRLINHPGVQSRTEIPNCMEQSQHKINFMRNIWHIWERATVEKEIERATVDPNHLHRCTYVAVHTCSTSSTLETNVQIIPFPGFQCTFPLYAPIMSPTPYSYRLLLNGLQGQRTKWTRIERTCIRLHEYCPWGPSSVEYRLVGRHQPQRYILFWNETWEILGTGNVSLEEK
jgi:hypothetical protein